MFHIQKDADIVCISCGDLLDTVHRYYVSLSPSCFHHKFSICEESKINCMCSSSLSVSDSLP